MGHSSSAFIVGFHFPSACKSGSRPVRLILSFSACAHTQPIAPSFPLTSGTYMTPTSVLLFASYKFPKSKGKKGRWVVYEGGTKKTERGVAAWNRTNMQMG